MISPFLFSEEGHRTGNGRFPGNSSCPESAPAYRQAGTNDENDYEERIPRMWQAVPYSCQLLAFAVFVTIS